MKIIDEKQKLNNLAKLNMEGKKENLNFRFNFLKQERAHWKKRGKETPVKERDIILCASFTP